jgi:hypothetical protein
MWRHHYDDNDASLELARQLQEQWENEDQQRAAHLQAQHDSDERYAQYLASPTADPIAIQRDAELARELELQLNGGEADPYTNGDEELARLLEMQGELQDDEDLYGDPAPTFTPPNSPMVERNMDGGSENAHANGPQRLALPPTPPITPERSGAEAPNHPEILVDIEEDEAPPPYTPRSAPEGILVEPETNPFRFRTHHSIDPRPHPEHYHAFLRPELEPGHSNLMEFNDTDFDASIRLARQLEMENEATAPANAASLVRHSKRLN